VWVGAGRRSGRVRFDRPASPGPARAELPADAESRCCGASPPDCAAVAFRRDAGGRAVSGDGAVMGGGVSCYLAGFAHLHVFRGGFGAEKRAPEGSTDWEVWDPFTALTFPCHESGKWKNFVRSFRCGDHCVRALSGESHGRVWGVVDACCRNARVRCGRGPGGQKRTSMWSGSGTGGETAPNRG